MRRPLVAVVAHPVRRHDRQSGVPVRMALVGHRPAPAPALVGRISLVRLGVTVWLPHSIRGWVRPVARRQAVARVAVPVAGAVAVSRSRSRTNPA
ncbi:MAG: hypothetical protein ACRDT6_21065 [Micromonosporaceae bacterium]